MFSVNAVGNGTQVTQGRPAKQSYGTCVLQLQYCWCWSQVIQQCQLGLSLPPRGFLYSFASLVLLPRKKLFIFPQKCLTKLESLLSLWNSASGKCVMSSTRPRSLIAVCEPKHDVVTPANACIRRPFVAQNKGWTLTATLSSPISLLRNENEVLWREPCTL